MSRLRVIRAERKLSQILLSIQSGVHASKISLIENGLVKPREDEIKKISKVLGMEAEEIFPATERNSGKTV